MQPSMELVAAVCEDAGCVFDAHVAKLPLDQIYASTEFGRLRERVRKEFPDATDQGIMAAVLRQYGERLRKI